jgi:2-polyprenyl-3-methyl-5-hydroxy-6-metoxy-1,4-benzoquinol methylase
MITTWSDGAPEANMDEHILIDLRDVVARHPWWLARADLILALLDRLNIRPPAAVLEAGCGWGINLAALEAAGYQITGLDVSRRMLERLDRPDRCLVEADLTQELPGRLPTYDCVLALDVIEHIDDDCYVLQQLARLLKPNGRLIISVPALPELFSEFDEVQGHRRRYTAESVRNCVEGAGLVVKNTRWWGQWMVRPLRARKSKRRGRAGETSADIYKRYLRLPPWPGPWVMKLIFRIDHWRTLRQRNLAGTSLIAVAALPPFPT